MKLFDSFLEIAGNLGFLVGNNDRRREQARKEKRSWGVEQDGFAVSIAASTLNPGADDSLRVEVALRNSTAEVKHVQVDGWLSFFSLTIMQPDGSEAQLNTFGRRQSEAAQAASTRSVVLPAGDILEADLPVGALYDLRQRGTYTMRGKSRASSAISNEIQIRI